MDCLDWNHRKKKENFLAVKRERPLDLHANQFTFICIHGNFTTSSSYFARLLVSWLVFYFGLGPFSYGLGRTNEKDAMQEEEEEKEKEEEHLHDRHRKQRMDSS